MALIIGYRNKSREGYHRVCWYHNERGKRELGYGSSCIEEVLEVGQSKRGEKCAYCGVWIEPERMTISEAKELCKGVLSRLVRSGYECKVWEGDCPQVWIDLQDRICEGTVKTSVWLSRVGNRFSIRRY